MRAGDPGHPSTRPAAGSRAELIGDVPVLTSLKEAVAAAPDLIVECAGHGAVRDYGPETLRRGIDFVVVSVGALADDRLRDALRDAALEGGARMTIASGAIAGPDGLSAARAGQLTCVTYVSRKPPQAWKGTSAETVCDLDRKYRPHRSGRPYRIFTRFPLVSAAAHPIYLQCLPRHGCQVCDGRHIYSLREERAASSGWEARLDRSGRHFACPERSLGTVRLRRTGFAWAVVFRAFQFPENRGETDHSRCRAG